MLQFTYILKITPEYVYIIILEMLKKICFYQSYENKKCLINID